MKVTDVGMSIDARTLHPLKADSPTVVSDSDNFTEARLTHDAKALLLIDVTELGIDISLRFLQVENADSSITSIDDGKVIDENIPLKKAFFLFS